MPRPRSRDHLLYELHAGVCQTLGNPKRLEIIDLLRDGEKSVGDLLQVMDISQSNLSQHLGLMRQKGIVSARREGLNAYYRLSSPKIIRACRLMRQVLMEHLAEGGRVAQEARG